MKLRALVLIVLFSGIGCSLIRPDKPRLHWTPVTGATEDVQPIVDASAAARFVLLGESTHGTKEFIDIRRTITEAIAAEGRLLAIVIEADAGETELASRLLETDASTAVRAFRGYPSWPWASEPFREALEALQLLNQERSPEDRVLLLGLDFHEFAPTLEALRQVARAPSVVQEIERTATCLERFDSAYAYGNASRGSSGVCSSLTTSLLSAVASESDPARRFRLAHLARTLEAAERYHVAIANGTDAWSFRESHMFQALLALDQHLAGEPGAIVVWAHNTHVGDARVTSFRPRPSLGQFFRESRPGQAYLVGLLTGRGTVYAARSMGSRPMEMKLHPPLRDSVEHVLARACRGSCVASTRLLASDLNIDRPIRAIGLVYRRDDEIRSHYLRTTAARQFDAIIYLDTTSSVGTLEP